MKSIEIPKEAAAIISALETDGFKAYAVGGCVRDRLLGAVPHDWDITTSARPDEIKHACRAWKTADTGRRYGTVSVIGSDGGYEVTTFSVTRPKLFSPARSKRIFHGAISPLMRLPQAAAAR